MITIKKTQNERKLLRFNDLSETCLSVAVFIRFPISALLLYCNVMYN